MKLCRFLVTAILTTSVRAEPQLLQWSGGTSPYYISVIPGGDVSASALKSFDATNATELTWTVDITSGTSMQALTVRAKDSTGAIAYSGEVSVQEGSDTRYVTTPYIGCC
ncbi:hypothetical protein CPB85DRAFT_1225608 [Mucidula mucida]|nr:hypothetical protein CPB85DRAFT_1225608 [Mucidula mucida]